MRFVAIGRGDFLFNSILHLESIGHEIAGIVSDIGAIEYTKQIEDFSSLAIKYGIPFLQSSSNQKITEFINDIPKIEIGISGNHRRIISRQVIDLFPLGLLNLHGGDLPRYRGNACQAWAILNGEKRIAACVHKMLPDELDAGNIIAREFFEIDEDTKIMETWDWLVSIAPVLFEKSFAELSNNPNFYLFNSKETPTRSHRCHERRPEDGQINWMESAERILRLVNASGKPYFGAFTYFNGKILKVFDAKIGSLSEDISAIPGQVVNIMAGQVSVACGSGILDLIEVEFEGIDVKVSDLLKSTRIRFGKSEKFL